MPSDEQRITVTDGGPYRVAGGVPLVAKRRVTTERGEPIAWQTGATLEAGERYALCRCGQSSDKPFCDGTHRDVEWDAGRDLPEGTYAERATRYEGDGITLVDDRAVCQHAGFCGNRVRNAWRMVRHTDDVEVRSHLVAMVERCPSGALTQELGGEVVEPDLPRQVAVTDAGPLAVTGGIPITDEHGDDLEVRNRVTLCRCGASGSKPLCDGSHADVGFTG